MFLLFVFICGYFGYSYYLFFFFSFILLSFSLLVLFLPSALRIVSFLFVLLLYLLLFLLFVLGLVCCLFCFPFIQSHMVSQLFVPRLRVRSELLGSKQ